LIRSHKRYPGNLEALQNITFEINSGELIFVTGPSGAGKSTLLKLIAAIEPPTHGTIIFENQNLSQIIKLCYSLREKKIWFDFSGS